MERESICPCKGCGRRNWYCHAACIEYAAWKADHEALREGRREAERGAKEADSINVEKIRRVKEAAQRCRTHGKLRGGRSDE